ncbi:RagB/SusD family nutrient uptake outer membrane protein [Mucilaginibacter dorajii]|uniref:RagB/SusD family nutrient uptake outer membrane protein n=1 Tax=Mucilaginibacter dorajii TaxID=692994 RepID=A0ABP7Q4Y3_9SPHI
MEVDPPIQAITGTEIYNSNSGAASVLTGIYASMVQGSFVQGISGISLRTGLSSDELTLDPSSNDQSLQNLYQNVSTYPTGSEFWPDLYAYIFRANDAIESIQSSKGISDQVKKQLLGEAKVIRAFCYFYLVNLYGDVPLLESTNYKINSVAPRSNNVIVYQKIISDLLEAQELLNDEYVSADASTTTSERVRPNKSVATALLARVYLYTKQWDKAETQASSIIANSKYKLESLDQVFLSNSQEAIWALQNRQTLDNLDGLLFNLLHSDNGPNPSQGRPVFLSSQLWKSFESGDNRKIQWADSISANGTTYPFVHKYKTDGNSVSITEYSMMFRLGEQYLIRAEARAQQGKITGANSATEDINLIRARAGLGNINANSQTAIINLIYKERQVELFTEGGHRWLDLKRTGEIENVMPTVSISKGGTWASFKALYAIPVADLKANPNLTGHQNPGYPQQ